MMMYAKKSNEKAYLPDGEANLITEELLPERGCFIALRFG